MIMFVFLNLPTGFDWFSREPSSCTGAHEESDGHVKTSEADGCWYNSSAMNGMGSGNGFLF
jgi:hypothetical protein